MFASCIYIAISNCDSRCVVLTSLSVATPRTLNLVNFSNYSDVSGMSGRLKPLTIDSEIADLIRTSGYESLQTSHLFVSIFPAFNPLHSGEASLGEDI